ncbi:hypothetical protein MJK72_21725 [Klebsiella pneumoniae]|nr:hypothetical protein MJK72_21725 [Klebsiella pneumoniae]
MKSRFPTMRWKPLSENGYDPVYGARPLKRAIQQQIENPLAQQNLSGELVPGQSYSCWKPTTIALWQCSKSPKRQKRAVWYSFLFKNQA